MKEIWKDIEGYEGKYQISTFGRVKSLYYHNGTEQRILKQRDNRSGYLIVNLYKNGHNKGNLKTVHRLVAEAFIPNPEHKPQINHKDENKTNNRVENLEWCDNRYNFLYSAERHPERYKNRKYTKRKNGNGRNGVRNSYKHKRKIIQKDCNGKVVNVYENARSVCIENNFNEWSIIQCCNGKRKTAYGYKWEFAE